MDQHAFQFANRGKQCKHITVTNNQIPFMQGLLLVNLKVR